MLPEITEWTIKAARGNSLFDDGSSVEIMGHCRDTRSSFLQLAEIARKRCGILHPGPGWPTRLPGIILGGKAA
jgi:hypothetical protein